MNIENKKQFATILLAIGLGLVAAMLMSKVVSDKVEQQTKTIAREYQGKSTALVQEMEKTKQTLEKLNQAHTALAKRVAEQPKVIQQQAPVAQKPVIQQMAFSLRTPPGKRAITIEIASLYAVGGLINPGDFVDVIAHLDLPGEEPAAASKKTKESERLTTVLFQNIQVLAVGTNFNPAGELPPYEMQQNSRTLDITLAVSPEEAGLLAFAEARGKLRLSLRSPAETDDKVLQQVASWDSLAEFVLQNQGTELRISEKKKPLIVDDGDKEIEEPKSSIQIFRGGREL